MLSEADIERFSRHVLLPEVGGRGQRAWLSSHARLARLDEAGRSAALWLVRSGVRRLELPVDDAPAPGVDASGLLRPEDAGRPLADVVASRLSEHGGPLAFGPGGFDVPTDGETAADGARAALTWLRARLDGARAEPGR